MSIVLLIQYLVSALYIVWQVPENNKLSTSCILKKSECLFTEDSVLNMTIKCDFNELLSDREENSIYHDALLVFNKNTYSIALKTRGIYRRKKRNCKLPPIWLKFDEAQISGTVFSNYKKIKLVLPCFNTSSGEQNILKEYLAYKIYNILTDYSFKVRLLNLRIVDLDHQNKPLQRYAFFIEPYKTLCLRVGGNVLKTKNIHPNYTDNELITLMSVFQYMIGNTDWSVKALHNIKLISRPSPLKPIAIPYDFDNSGLVNAPYALPAEHLGVSSVKERVYNGYYRPIQDLEPVLKIFKQKKVLIYQEVQNVQGLKVRNIDETIKYFDQFYKTLDHTKRIQYELIDKSRKE